MVKVSKYWEKKIGNLTILTNPEKIRENEERIRNESKTVYVLGRK